MPSPLAPLIARAVVLGVPAVELGEGRGAQAVNEYGGAPECLEEEFL